MSKVARERMRLKHYIIDCFTLAWLKKRGQLHLQTRDQLACLTFDYISAHINIYGRFEDPLLDWLEKNLADFLHDKAVVDIGANIGNHSLAFAKFAREVHAFEP